VDPTLCLQFKLAEEFHTASKDFEHSEHVPAAARRKSTTSQDELELCHCCFCTAPPSKEKRLFMQMALYFYLFKSYQSNSF